MHEITIIPKIRNLLQEQLNIIISLKPAYIRLKLSSAICRVIFNDNFIVQSYEKRQILADASVLYDHICRTIKKWGCINIRPTSRWIITLAIVIMSLEYISVQKMYIEAHLMGQNCSNALPTAKQFVKNKL